MKKLLGLFIVAFMFAGETAAQDQQEVRATPADAEALVKNAVAYLKRHGKEKAFKEFENKNGPFVYRDLFIVANDFKCICRSHGARPHLIGKDLTELRDTNGFAYVQAQRDIAKTKGSGWVEFQNKNPANGKIEHKTAYVERFEDLFVVSGAYKP